MKLVFLGTRGYVEPANRRHRHHSALLVGYRGREVMIDCGQSWRHALGAIRPRALLLTHAHPDHAAGLDRGAPCPVWASRETWERIADYPIASSRRRLLAPRRPRRIQGIRFEAFPVIHSLRAPAVGYRIRAGRVTVFYAPDVIAVDDRAAALGGCRVYIGDGASLTRSLVRRRPKTGELFGHTTVRAQLGWCAAEGVPRMLITHCGAEIVAGDERHLRAQVRFLARERGVEARIAHDGLELTLR